jgi:hypothetical protein
MLYCNLQYKDAIERALHLVSTPVAKRENVMLTQADRYELKQHIIDILNDTGLPSYLKVNRLADLLEDRFITKMLEIAAFEEPRSRLLPSARTPARKSPTRQQPTRRKNATSARASASARKGG